MLFILRSAVDGTLDFVEAVEEVGGAEGFRELDADVSSKAVVHEDYKLLDRRLWSYGGVI